MKYSKQWEADRIRSGWTKTDSGEYWEIYCNVIRPGTVDNGRTVRVKMSRDQATDLVNNLTRLLTIGQ